ncbi:PREDICTED: 2-alkenal reductase [Prunus dulcis]|uniref:PREDICTED: 2-alkenal reductase n=1 Tax=Prunus dulcis TaxID=3755 RepID=A0A5E4EPL1_PRUDU|nr:PREDICTED: 2-alkenal reductase [Prunus dulcis]
MGGVGEDMRVLESREWYIASYAPQGVPNSDHLKIRTAKLSLALNSIPERHVVLETLFLSVDPYLRSRMTGREDGLYLPHIFTVIIAFGVGRVIKSNDPNYSEGVPGFAAWVGIEVIADPKPGSNVFISAAAGGVGMYAGQLAKLEGCRVIGSTGSDEKVRLIKEEFGYDDAFNYHKEKDFDAALSKYFPNGIDVYLDNVGGRMLEAVLNHVNKHAKIPLCGMISEYNKAWTEREGVRNLLNLVGKEVHMQGFMLGSYMDRFGDFAKEMEGHLKHGKIGSKIKIFHGIDKFLESLGSLFTSCNIGKVVIQVNE